ncbi:abc transporter, abc-binding protein [Heliomicrobium modesticaldum Ice1]|uniref:Abc transporter, abc-binding protein n=1 Tax=Heliobacterium modesticaldum (strain ATCC 51547 / Ice1) TaxID=498761 RepID=B0TBU9_HELMI|nr:ABC transporter ATP-binding protein [Heliomicrobium modesticaldum]ABZ85222.1 abc transporter, abc-binding protein [Heliomicrobium modesticaldum Ice1]
MDDMVEMIDITKRFPGVVANDRVSFAVRKGEIHALLGENGAGKSTLMNVLTGLYRPDGGEIRINGRPVELLSPRDAVAHGIGMVHQHFKLVKPFTVSENILLGLKGIRQVYDIRAINAQVRAASEKYSLLVDPAAPVWQLSVGEQQRVEILKILFRGADIIILDEPTAVLTPQEAVSLYATLRRMADEGKAIIVISHKLSEVLGNTDRITVLRGGRSVGTVYTAETDEMQLTQMMVGRTVILRTDKAPAKRGDKILELTDVSALNDRGLPALKSLSLDIYGGEILGIAGVAGNGQRELAEVVAGLRAIETGVKKINGVEMTQATPKAMIRAGVSYIPEDRLGTGLAPNMNAVENYLLKGGGEARGIINWKKAARDTDEIIQRFDVKIANAKEPVKMLSGGNLQKLLLGREISNNPRLIVAMYPMRGLDVGAMETIRNLLVAQRDAGVAILLISEELEELFDLSDRIAVLHGGEIMGVVDPRAATIEAVGMMMAGERMDAAARRVKRDAS